MIKFEETTNAADIAQHEFVRCIQNVLGPESLDITAFQISIHVTDEIWMELERTRGRRSSKWMYSVYLDTLEDGCDIPTATLFERGSGPKLRDVLEEAALAIADYLCTTVVQRTESGMSAERLLVREEVAEEEEPDELPR